MMTKGGRGGIARAGPSEHGGLSTYAGSVRTRGNQTLKYPVWQKGANPAIDPPHHHENRTNLRQGAMMTGKKSWTEAAIELHAAMNDWQIVRLSHLPRRQVLLITTRQLKTRL
jgi:hypothetical protein